MKARRTDVWCIDPSSIDGSIIDRAAAIIRAGGLVAFPTETVYGLGANALDSTAVHRIYAVKGRPANNPIIVHVADVSMARRLTSDWPARASRLAEQFWPGPLTLVLPRSQAVPDVVTAGGPTVALRWPAHPVAQALIRAAGVPIAAPSANRSGELSPTCAEHVLRSLDGRIDAILDGGATIAGIESTVIDLSGPTPRLLRPGPIPPREIEAIIGPVDRPAAMTVSADRVLPSPGLLARHYAPRTPLECHPTTEALERRMRELLNQGVRCAVVVGDDVHIAENGARFERLPAAPEAYAAALYRTLHELDRGGFERILVLIPPDDDRWLAVRDRLRRAAAP